MSHNFTHKQNEICYAQVVNPTHLWGINVSPLKDPVPQLILQMALAIGVHHGLLLVFQRFGQPRFVSDIMVTDFLFFIHDNV